MRFTDAIRSAQQTHWSYVNTFEVYFMWNPVLAAPSETGDNILNWSTRDNERLSLSIISVDTPQISHNQISSYIAGAWRQIQGREEQFKFSMTFKDINQMEWHRKFFTQYREQKCRYFDNYKFDVLVVKDSDYGDGHPKFLKGTESKQHEVFRRCGIESISQIQYSNATENQHAEFSVNFWADEMSVLTDGKRSGPIDVDGSGGSVIDNVIGNGPGGSPNTNPSGGLGDLVDGGDLGGLPDIIPGGSSGIDDIIDDLGGANDILDGLGNLNDFGDIITNAIGGIVDVETIGTDILGNIGDKVGGILNGVDDLIPDLGDIIADLDKLPDTIIDEIKNTAPELIETVVDITDNIPNLTEIFDNLKDITSLDDLNESGISVDSMIDKFTELSTELQDQISKVVPGTDTESFIDDLTNSNENIQNILEKLKGFNENIGSVLTDSGMTPPFVQP